MYPLKLKGGTHYKKCKIYVIYIVMEALRLQLKTIFIIRFSGPKVMLVWCEQPTKKYFIYV